MIGSTISHYRIVSELGRGGMGTVYLAEDMRLGREVAIKVLPTHALDGGHEAARFGREAQAAAALNHPNIATVHEIDEVDEKSFIVMEYVDGPSLKDRIEEGPLPLDESIRLAIQVAGGLAAAHEKGIVHRDIKPANVMLTSKGDAKIMDFGLAQLTDVTQITKTGTTIGTVVYMSPEQARGEKTDHRSDIFSLGATLYEMVVGRRAFQGAYSEAIVYSILNEEPQPLTALRTGVPMELERIVTKALAKKSAERYQGMKDLLVDLRALEKALPERSGAASATRLKPVATRANRWKTSLPWGLATLLLAALVYNRLIVTTSGPEVSVDHSATWAFEYPLPPGYSFRSNNVGGAADGLASSIALSRDGLQLAFVAWKDDIPKLFLKRARDFEPREIPGSEGADVPFFSPDGEWLGYTLKRTSLMKVATSGGRPIPIVKDIDWVLGADWMEDGRIVLKEGYTNLLQVVSEDGGAMEVFGDTNSSRRGGMEWSPQVLPGDRGVLAMKMNEGMGVSVVRLDRATFQLTPVLNTVGAARYLPNGYLLFERFANLMYAPIDLDSWKVGKEQTLADDLYWYNRMGYANWVLATASGNTVAFVRGPNLSETTNGIVKLNVETGESTPIFERHSYASVRLSPDGKHVIAEGNRILWLGDLSLNTIAEVNTDGLLRQPLWINEGNAILYTDIRASDVRRVRTIDITSADRVETLLLDDIGSTLVGAWSEKHGILIGGDLSILSLSEAEGRPEPWLRSQGTQYGQPALSPDEEYLAYTSNQGGQWEVYVGKFPGKTREYRVSTDGGVEPIWSPDGRTIYFRSENGSRIYAAAFDPAGLPPVETPRPLWDGEYTTSASFGRSWDISPDGRDFYLIDLPTQPQLSTEEGNLDRISIILNWRPEDGS